MSTHVRHDHELLLESLLDGRLPRSLAWKHVVELVSRIGEVIPNGGDEFTFVVEGQKLKVKRPHHDELDVEETSRLRKFLKESHANKPSTVLAGKQSIVVVDHHVAHIYHHLQEGATIAEDSIKPYDPFGFRHHLIHRKEAHYNGDRVPEENSYYQEISAYLGNNGPIFLVGDAKGKSSAMNHLLEYLGQHHPDIFARVTATEAVDLSALTDLEIEAMVRERLSNS